MSNIFSILKSQHYIGDVYVRNFLNLLTIVRCSSGSVPPRNKPHLTVGMEIDKTLQFSSHSFQIVANITGFDLRER